VSTVFAEEAYNAVGVDAMCTCERGARGSLPKSITVDNGSEFCSRALEAWAMTNEVQLCFIRPGRPVENGFINSN